MQFWEDVEDGLDDIEAFYARRQQDIDRIRQFAQSARGELPPPTGYAPGHEPSEEHVAGLTAKPFWDVVSEPTLFPWAAELEAKSDVIMREFESKLTSTANQDKEEHPNMFASDSVWQNNVMGSGWSAIRLQRLGVWNEENCKEFPETYQLLRSLGIPLAVRGVCFARQAPKSGVQPHSDGRNFILTSHLGLRVPDGCWIQVGEERRTWSKGKLLTLDTSFEHSTGNPTDSERHVLIIDFWHPELTEAERAALEFVYDLRNKFESGQVPVRKPRSLQKQQEGTGLGSLWNKLTGTK
jgi:aspartate beta-hydroxylase